MMLLKASRLFDVSTGAVIYQPFILINENRIIGVGQEDNRWLNELLQKFPDLQFLDLDNLTLLPGLIDCHTHITYSYGQGNETLPLAIENARQTLNSGFTTIRDEGCSNGTDIILRDQINNGTVVGPRILTSGVPILPRDVDRNEAYLVSNRFQQGSNHIKVFNSAPNGIPELGVDQISEIVNTSRRFGLPVSVHAYEPETIVVSSGGGCNSIEHGSYLNDYAANVMSRNRTVLVATLSLPHHYLNNRDKFNFDPETWKHFEKVASSNLHSVQLAKANGVPIIFGTDSVAGMHGHNANEFFWLMKAGLTPLEAIQSATINAGNFLKLPIGQLRQGYYADIIGVQGNPLEDIRALLPENVKFVMKDGRIVKM